MSTKRIEGTALNWMKLSCILLLTLSTLVTQAQSKVSGKVTSEEDGDGLPGVNIIIKGTTQGTITDFEGNYQIDAPSDAVLVFSFLGFAQEEITVGNQKVINVALRYDSKALEEVVVVGYGSMERSNVTGAISSISSKEIQKAPVPNLVESMRGQIPGLRMTRTSGAPGSEVNFLIRGKNSLNSSNNPLIVIDGVPTTGGNIAEINPADIESVNIMKDAAAASIYGTRGANGVILITTKNGSKGKPKFNVKFSQGVTSLAHQPELYDAAGYVQLKMDAAEGANKPHTIDDVLTDAVERANYDAGNEIDWHDVLIQNGKQTNAGVSMSAGTDKMNLYMNADMYAEEGIAIKTDYKRFSYRLNTDYSPYDFLKLGARVQLTATSSDETGGLAVPIAGDIPLFFTFVNNTPLGRLKNENGEIVPTIKADQFAYNPQFKYRESAADRTTSRTYLNPYVEFKILKGLKYTLNTYVERRTDRLNIFRSSKYNWSTLNDEPGNNQMSVANRVSDTYLVDNILNYDRTFGKHSINGSLVYGFQSFKTDIMTLSNEGTGTDLISYYSIGVQTDYMRTQYDADEWNILYLASRLSYSYDDRYVITGTLRRDGSTRFGAQNKWGYFPSISMAWNIHDEAFMPKTDWINVLKLRASLGVLGNDQIGTYRYASLTQTVVYPFNNTIHNGQIAGNIPNPDLKWEESRQKNVGIDFTILKKRAYGTIDLYKTNTVDLLLAEQVSAISGDSNNPPSILSNVGETQNHGMEISFNYDVFQKKDLQWEVGANWAFDRNKIVRLNNPDANGNQVDNPANNWFVGQDIDVVYNYDFVGIYQKGEEDLASSLHPTIFGYGPGDPKIRDVNGDGVITFDDQTFLGTATPKWYGGLRNTLRYKGLELTVLFEAVMGVTRINYFYGGLTGRSNQIKVDYWTPKNPSNEFPQPHQDSGYRYADAVRVRDASFVSLRNVSLSYNIPNSLLHKARIQNAQIFVRGNNLKYFTDYDASYSPETNFGAFPVTKVWTVGTNFTF